MKDELRDSMVGVEVEFPSVAWVVATLRWVPSSSSFSREGYRLSHGGRSINQYKLIRRR
jgi:hypothetical protein